MDDTEARSKIAEAMMDRLLGRLPDHTRTQRLALLRLAFSEMRHRSLAHPPPVEFDAAGKPKPPGPGEQAFAVVSDVLFDEMATILGV
jgi:hypothetical protein